MDSDRLRPGASSEPDRLDLELASETIDERCDCTAEDKLCELLGHVCGLGHSWGPMNGTMKEVISSLLKVGSTWADLSQIESAGTM